MSGKKTRSLGEFLENHVYTLEGIDPVFMKFCQNVFLN